MSKLPSDFKRVIDFQDFNYERVAFDINFMCEGDRKALKERLKRDYVNHLYRFDGAVYFAIWNSDFQDFKSIDDIYFDSYEYDYKLVRLRFFDGEWYCQFIEDREVSKERRM